MLKFKKGEHFDSYDAKELTAALTKSFGPTIDKDGRMAWYIAATGSVIVVGVNDSLPLKEVEAVCKSIFDKAKPKTKKK